MAVATNYNLLCFFPEQQFNIFLTLKFSTFFKSYLR